MFQSLVNRAQRSVDSLVSKYVARAVVAVPFIIAMGFGTAAAAVKLTAEYGSMTAYTIIAAAFSAVGLVAAMAIALSSSQPNAASGPGLQQASADTTVEQAATKEAEADFSVDPATALSTLATVGPALAPHLLRMLARNLPLAAGLAILAYLLFAQAASKPRSPASAAAAET